MSVPDYSNYSNFSEAFKNARKELGFKKTFYFQGKLYRTDAKEDVDSPWYDKAIPNSYGDKFKIDHKSDTLLQFIENKWKEVIDVNGQIVLKNDKKTIENIKSYKKEKPTKITAKLTQQDILSNPLIQKKYPSVAELFVAGDIGGAWEKLLSEDMSYANMTHGEIIGTEDWSEQVFIKGTTQGYSSANPFAFLTKVETDEDEPPLSTINTFQTNWLDSDTYHLIKMYDETTDPNEPIRYWKYIEDDDVLHKLVNIPNNFEDAQTQEMGDKWKDAQKLYDEGYRLVTDDGDIMFGYKEQVLQNQMFTVDKEPKEKTAGDVFDDIKKDYGTRFLPFISSTKQALDLMKVYDALEHLELGVETGEDLQLLKQFYDKNNVDPTWGALLLEGVSQMPAFFGEIASTSGMTKVFQKGSEKLVKKSLKKLMTKSGGELLEKKLLDYSIKAGTHVGANLLRTQTAFSPRIMKSTIENLLPQFEIGHDIDGELMAMITGDGMNLTDAYKWASIDTFVEVMSEQAGEGFLMLWNKMPKPKKELMARLSLVKILEELNPNMTKGQLSTVLKKGGFHGAIPEMFEEEVALAVKGLIHEIDDGDESFAYRRPSFKEYSAMFTSFLVPTAMGTGFNYTVNFQNVEIGRQANKFLKKPRFKRRDSVKTVTKALKDGIIDQNTANYMYLILGNNSNFDDTSLLKIFDKVNEVTKQKKIKEIMEEKQISKKEAEKEFITWLEGEGINDPEDVTMVRIMGSTSVDTFDSGNKVVLSLYDSKNLSNNTIIEEFLGYYYKTMPISEREQFKEVYKNAKAGGKTKLTEQEYFEKNGVKYILRESEFGSHPLIQFWDKAKDGFKEMFNMLDGIYEMPDNVEVMYDNLFPGTEKKEFNIQIEEKPKKEVSNVNKEYNGDGTSYDVISVKEVAEKLANKTILNPDGAKDKNLRNKYINRGVLQGFKNIMDALQKNTINIDGARKWYNESVQGAFNYLKKEIPEVGDKPELETFAKIVMAITSNGQKVRPNWTQTVELVKEFVKNGTFKHLIKEKKTVDKKTGIEHTNEYVMVNNLNNVPKVVGGIRGKAQKEHLILLEGLIEDLGMSGAMRFMLEKQDASYINEKVGFKYKTGEHYGSLRFGKKLGAFFLNMNGISEHPTFDVWWSRTYNRWMGTPLNIAGTEQQDAPRNESERKVMTQILYRLSDKLSDFYGERIKPEDVQALLWYYEKDLYINSGTRKEDLSFDFKDVAQERWELKNEQFTTSENNKKSQQVGQVRDAKPGEEGRSDRDVKARNKEIRESIRKGTSYQISAFHGSTKPNIIKFDPDKGVRVGRAQGYGTYFTDRKDVAKHYAHMPDGSEKGDKSTVYDVIIHKGKRPSEYDYLVWSDAPNPKQTEKIIKAINVLPEQGQQELFELWNTIQTGKPSTYESLVYGLGRTHHMDVTYDAPGTWNTRDIYDLVATQFYKMDYVGKGTANVHEIHKKTSMFLLNAGIDGIEFRIGNKMAKNLEPFPKGFVVFDANEIEIQKQESYKLKVVKRKLELEPETLREWFFQKIVDKHARMFGVQETLSSVPRDLDVHLKMVAYPGRTKAKLQKVEDFVESLFKAVEKAGFTVNQLEDYLYALHTHERNKLVRERTGGENDAGAGMTDADANDIIDKYQGSKLDKIAERFYKNVTQKRLKILLDNGFITQDQYDQYQEQFKNYVPLKGRTGVVQYMMNLARGFDVRGQDIHRAGGRNSRADNVILQSVADLQETIQRVEKNRVSITLSKLIKKNPSSLWKVKKPKYKLYKPTWDTEGNYEYVMPENLGDNEVGFIDNVNGKRVPMIIEINDQSIIEREPITGKLRNPLMQTIKTIGVEHSIPYIQKINKHLRSVYTTFSPNFVISNFERDLQTAFANLQVDYTTEDALLIMKDIPLALKGVFRNVRGYKKSGDKWNKLYEEYKDAGGQMGWFDSATVDEKVNELNKRLEMLSKGNKPRKMIGEVAKFIEDLNQAVESGVRLSTYSFMKKKGMTKEQAMAVAKDLTVNFNRKGEWGSLVNSLYLFANAGVQGAVNVGKRAFFTDKGRALSGTLFGLGMMNAFINKQMCPEGYDKISGYKKDNYMMFMTPDCDIALKLRMPYGWGVFKSTGGIAFDYMNGDIDEGEATARIFSSLDHSFNPLGGGTPLQTMSPTLFDPVVQIREGKDYKGDDLYPREWGYYETPDWSKTKRYTSEKYKKSAKWMNDITGGNELEPGMVDISPETIKTWANFLGGGAWNFAQQSWDIGKSAIVDAELPRVRNDEIKTGLINYNVIPIVSQHVERPADYTISSKMYKMLNKSKSHYYNTHWTDKFKYYLDLAVQDGTIDREKAYGKDGTGGHLNEFINNQREIYEERN